MQPWCIRSGALVNLTADAASLDAVAPAVDAFLAALPAQPTAGAPWGDTRGLLLPGCNEALTVPTQVRRRTRTRTRVGGRGGEGGQGARMCVGGVGGGVGGGARACAMRR